MKDQRTHRTENQCMFVSGGKPEDGVVITHSSVSGCKGILSNQEANTRLILHVHAFVDAGANVMVVCSPDTDVLVLLLHHWLSVKDKQSYFLTGRKETYQSYRIHTHPYSEHLSHQAPV